MDDGDYKQVQGIYLINHESSETFPAVSVVLNGLFIRTFRQKETTQRVQQPFALKYEVSFCSFFVIDKRPSCLCKSNVQDVKSRSVVKVNNVFHEFWKYSKDVLALTFTLSSHDVLWYHLLNVYQQTPVETLVIETNCWKWAHFCRKQDGNRRTWLDHLMSVLFLQQSRVCCHFIKCLIYSFIQLTILIHHHKNQRMNQNSPQAVNEPHKVSSHSWKVWRVRVSARLTRNTLKLPVALLHQLQ